MKITKGENLNVPPELVFYALQVILLAGVGLLILKQAQKCWRKRNEKTYPKDLVILHQFPRGVRAPNASPFALKLETWLRMADIKYQPSFGLEMSSKGKIPWISHNGLEMGDSQLIMEYLMRYFDKDLSSHLNPIERSMARAYSKLNEESLRWTGLVHRFKYGKPEDCGLSFVMFKFGGRNMLKDAFGQGYGRHSKEEVYDIGIKDLNAFEAFIGGKKFLMGERVCNEDASIFGVLAQLINHDRGPLNQHLMKNCPNLKRYFETMKSIYWADWNECITEKPQHPPQQTNNQHSSNV